MDVLDLLDVIAVLDVTDLLDMALQATACSNDSSRIYVTESWKPQQECARILGLTSMLNVVDLRLEP